MSGIMLNLDFNGSSHDGRQMKPAGNAKHRRFVKRRRHLERRGLLNKKQNTSNFRKEGHRNNQWHKQNKREDDSPAGAVFPKFSSAQCELSMKSSSSVQANHGNCAAETDKESIVPSRSTSYRESTSALQRVVPSLGSPQKYIALDCEMVGTGPKGHCSELARCSIVTYDGDVIYDKFIKPVNLVTDYRTRWSGIRKRDLYKATPFKQAQREILKILSGKVVVGHDVQNDFKVLHYSHPDCLTRDTSRMPLLNQKAGLPEDRTASLKILTKLLFNKDIQVGKKGHSSVEDAKATMELYKLVELEWERTVASKKDDSSIGAVFPKFSSAQRELAMKSSSSVQADHGNCAAETDKESIVPSRSTSYVQSTSTLQRVAPSLGKPQKYIALDCEMVGTGPKGHCSELARCSIVTYDGDVIYDRFVKPVNLVTDYRTRWSGIRKHDLCNATPFKQAQREILKILSGKVVVGHDVQNDFKVLHYSHPDCLTRDTSRMPLLNQKAGLPEDRTASLKILTKLLFNKDIQVGKKGHSSVEDAKATMELYKLVELEWERTVASKSGC